MCSSRHSYYGTRRRGGIWFQWWWMFWLIWPLSGFIKGMSYSASNSISQLTATLNAWAGAHLTIGFSLDMPGTQISNTLISLSLLDLVQSAVLLSMIVVGLVLWNQRRSSKVSGASTNTPVPASLPDPEPIVPEPTFSAPATRHLDE